MSDTICKKCFNHDSDKDYINCSQCDKKEYYCEKCVSKIPYYKGYGDHDYFQFCMKCIGDKNCYLCGYRLNGYLDYFGMIKADNTIYQNRDLIEEDYYRKYSIEVSNYNEETIILCNRCDQKQQDFFSYYLYDVFNEYDQTLYYDHIRIYLRYIKLESDLKICKKELRKIKPLYSKFKGMILEDCLKVLPKDLQRLIGTYL